MIRSSAGFELLAGRTSVGTPRTGIPGNVAVAVMGPGVNRNARAIKVFDADYGFNLPWYRQYFVWLGNLLRGNLGYSWKSGQSVASLLATALPRTVLLVVPATLLALAVAIPIGLLQAIRRNKPSRPEIAASARNDRVAVEFNCI
jgi:peptide/nickel transport system permease protein